MRKISVFGLGYVGTITAACLAELGNSVIGLDKNPIKAEAVNAGRSPIIEADADSMIAAAQRAGRLRAVSDVNLALRETDVSFVSVATPSQRNGKLDLSSMELVCTEIGTALRQKNTFHTIAIRSTVLPGTTESVVIPIMESASGKRAGRDFAVCANPEFMREGTAVKDFFRPPFTIIGSANPEHAGPLKEIYSQIPGQVFQTPVSTAETIKYVCNAYHALKVCFANEVGSICQQAGVDAERVMDIFATDTKLNISAAYLKPGFAFGGSCLPKDLRALTYKAKELDLHLPLLASIIPSNDAHIERAMQSVLQSGKRKIGVLGLSFKSGTDDLRESPAVQLIKRLIGEGSNIKVWDDNVMLGRLVGSNRQYIEEVIPHIGSLLCADVREVVAFAEVVVIANKALDRETIVHLLEPEQIVIDLVGALGTVPAQAASI